MGDGMMMVDRYEGLEMFSVCEMGWKYWERETQGMIGGIRKYIYKRLTVTGSDKGTTIQQFYFKLQIANCKWKGLVRRLGFQDR